MKASWCKIILGVRLLVSLPFRAHGHGYLFQPVSRNLQKHKDNLENCPHCGQAGGPGNVEVRGNHIWPTHGAYGSHGLCGDPFQGESNTPLDQEPYLVYTTSVQKTYTAGDIVTFLVAISTHHKGHFEFRICNKRLDSTLVSHESGQLCLDEWILERVPPGESYSDCQVDDVRGDCQPVDPNNPGRWYLPPASVGVQVAGDHWSDEAAAAIDGFDGELPGGSVLYHMKYKIPAGLSCEQCTLQWYWATGNTCIYDEHYLTYFRKMQNDGWNAARWSPFSVATWSSWEASGCKAGKFAEEFWNCADIAVLPGEPTPPTPPTAEPPSPEPATPDPVQAKPEPEPESEPESQGDVDSNAAFCCLWIADGIDPCNGGCDAHNVKLPSSGEWCAKDEGHCDACNGVWCEGSPAEETTIPPTPVPAACRRWCSKNKKGWSAKCKWKRCGGCSDCTAPEPEPQTAPTPQPQLVAPTRAPTRTPPAQGEIGQTWESGMKMTHYWDCNGQGCDSTVLQPWDINKYVSPSGYGPQDPENFGGSIYGEKMWLTGAASDYLANMLGEDDGCCGADTASGACGKCLLVQNPSSLHPDWTAVLMKKNRCPPWTNGCAASQPHFDVAVPGFDNLQWSTANVCGIRQGTGFASQSQSAALGSWYQRCSDTSECSDLCDQLPSDFVAGCRLFASWGWTRGDPDNVKFRAVECPAAFVTHISNQFGPSGPVTSVSAIEVMSDIRLNQTETRGGAQAAVAAKVRAHNKFLALVQLRRTVDSVSIETSEAELEDVRQEL